MKPSHEDSPHRVPRSNAGGGQADRPYRSRAFGAMLEWIRRVATADLPVLVRGESGSGKEGVSLAVHRLSSRSAGPFVPVNCTALTETLLDAELFGTVRGAYTGSDRDRPGLFRVADGGTLFLDEVGDMPPSMQAKLLRALEHGGVRPVGGHEEVAVNVRIVAATHRDLEAMVREGRFRADLYHRLAVLRIDVPPLRRRLEDLALLVDELTPRLCRETGRPAPRFTPAAWHELRRYGWPGNVRELRSVLARAMLRADGREVQVADLGLRAGNGRAVARRLERPVPLERRMIESALAETGGNVTAAAANIGWTRQKLYRRMNALSVAATPAAG